MVKISTESETQIKSEVKQKKVKTTKKSVPVIVEQVVEPVVEQDVEPVVEQDVEPDVENGIETVVEPLVEPLIEPVVEPVVEQEESNTEILFNKLINQFQDIQSVMKTLHSNLKVLQKEVLKERKESKKKESKIKKKNSKKRSPSGFAKPTQVSDDLANFLNLPSGTELARTEVTSKVIAYIKEHNLQNPSNKKQILLDDNLNKLLLPGNKDIVTFFNLQTYLKKHFTSQATAIIQALLQETVEVV